MKANSAKSLKVHPLNIVSKSFVDQNPIFIFKRNFLLLFYPPFVVFYFISVMIFFTIFFLRVYVGFGIIFITFSFFIVFSGFFPSFSVIFFYYDSFVGLSRVAFFLVTWTYQYETKNAFVQLTSFFLYFE